MFFYSFYTNVHRTAHAFIWWIFTARWKSKIFLNFAVHWVPFLLDTSQFFRSVFARSCTDLFGHRSEPCLQFVFSSHYTQLRGHIKLELNSRGDETIIFCSVGDLAFTRYQN